LNECPKYHHRHAGNYVDPAGFSSGSKIKLNLWGAISCRGASDFVVF
jgi:hypothetical protein